MQPAAPQWQRHNFNSLAPGRCGGNLERFIFKLIIQNSTLGTNCEIDLRWVNIMELPEWDVNIGSGNGLVPSGNKPLPEIMLTAIYVVVWHH